MDPDTAETIAISALAFLADDEQRLGRFLALTGLGPAELSAQARAPRILASVLDYLLQDESLLLVFAASHRIAPDQISPAQQLLAKRAGG
ncbi:MAG: DUF3572 domain-containing protein [Hyphomicrobium sp.]